MRHLFIIILMCTFGIASSQQKNNLDIAVQHIKNQAENWKLESSDYAGLMISSEVNASNGITYLYLNQAYENIPIRNAMMTMVIKDGKVLSDAHQFVTNIASKVNTLTPSFTPDVAILKSAEHLGISVKGAPVVAKRNDQGKVYYDFPSLTKSSIPAELKYDIVDDKLILVWNLNLDMKTNADYWDMNIDATTGAFISKHNFTTYCKHHHDNYARHNDCAIKTFRNINDHRQSVSDAITSGSSAAKYNVFALPAESPIHGDRKIVSDDQYPLYSPYGWHDTDGADGPEFTITRGNNVYAYQDKNDDDGSDGPETDGGAELNFDFPVDFSKDPRESANAAVTNLFYMVNMMHDVTAALGFTEEFGNFQQKNYSGKGDGGDYVLAETFDGITLHEAGADLDENGNPTKINNANFSTLNDGFNGRMQMYLWNNKGGAVSIDSPAEIEGFIAEYGTAGFGFTIPGATQQPIKGSIALAKSVTSNPNSGCGNITNSAEITGKIAMIDRGLCDFSKKVFNVQQGGAIAAIVCNIPGIGGGNGDSVEGMGGGDNAGSVTIPSIMLKKSDCDKIKIILEKGGNVVMTMQDRSTNQSKYLDGSLDNGIIAHEFGHGISNRLTGGRQASSCLQNDEQMGEGWSDFFALIMTHRPGDKGSDARGIGNFADARKAEGSGIRRFPYSTDMLINPQTFNSVKGTKSPTSPCNGCHSLGEIWADVLWDMYWAFIDQYGYDPDLKNTNSGNYKAVYLVMEGMKMQACNPGFIIGRDAIFKADEVHFASANKCLIWNVFARRGLGFFADGGSKDDRDDGKEDFEALPTCIEKLKISKTATSSINAGDEVNVTLKAINHIPSRQNNVVITDELPDGMAYVAGSSSLEPKIIGNMLTFELGDMDYQREIILTYKTKSDKDRKSIRLEIEDFDNDIFWDFETEKGSEYWVPSYDLYRSPETSLYVINVAAELDASTTSTPYLVTGNNPVMRFWHRYNTEAGNDGGFVEVSVDNGPFVSVRKDQFIRNGYNGPLAYGTLAIPALNAFSGNSGGNWTGDLTGDWIDSYFDLSEYKGREIRVRFRFGSDELAAATGDLTGWYIDDVEILDIYKYSSQACIAADDGQGEKACTLPLETIVNSELTSGINDIENKFFNVTLTPNPADDYVVISASAPINTSAKVTILSSEGKPVYTTYMDLDKNVSQKLINTTGFVSGFYILTIQNGLQVTTKKLVIK